MPENAPEQSAAPETSPRPEARPQRAPQGQQGGGATPDVKPFTAADAADPAALAQALDVIRAQHEDDPYFKNDRQAFERIEKSQKTQQALAGASEQTGVAERDLWVMAALESAGKPDARNGSYRGLMQMGQSAAEEVDMPWKDVATDVNANALAGAKYWQHHEGRMEDAGIESNVLNQYLAHQQGFGGMRKLLRTVATDPDKRATRAQLANLPPEFIQSLGKSRSQVTQQDFLKFWEDRVKSAEAAFDMHQGQQTLQDDLMAIGGAGAHQAPIKAGGRPGVEDDETV
ncbi:MAG: transglycosylase SLT domain-containing protein [Myxococcales bacterium]|nr:transglycosylase SLT domain-containing protein [Myxococcales bacterium]MCB9525457.1 transglycosylase SLT domain-containing protein [Myxococcales bacterium]MCB9526646.1 transglycosylase SLT domain-containing protein [Myxococcales bacterium]